MLPTKKMSNKLNTSTPPLSAVEVAGNTDLLTEILIRLPIKPLIRFKSVSKLWLSLISDPKFSLLHRRPSNSSAAAAGLFLERSNGEYDFYDIINTNPSRPPFKSLAFGSDNTSGLRIAQSCNGLLLCYDDSGSFCVFNPTTKRRTALPPPPPHSGSTAPESCPYSFNLAFDPSQSAHYKAIYVRNFTGKDGQYQIDIYSSETGAWRPSSLGFFDSGLCYSFDRGVFWNGSVYWINAWGDFLRFEVDAERVHMIPMPPVPESLDLEDCYRDSGYLQVSGDSLHFIDHFIEPGASRFPVYEMERDGSGWFVKYEVDVSEVCKAFPEMIWRYDFDPEVDNYHLSVLCVVCCVVEEESYLLMNIVGKVLRYNFKDGSFCWLCDVPIVDGSDKVWNPSEVHPFIASLACV